MIFLWRNKASVCLFLLVNIKRECGFIEYLCHGNSQYSFFMGESHWPFSLFSIIPELSHLPYILKGWAS